ncbi:MAG: TetR/AcrR family transcriptional regulator [Planctomycetes bacterium]|nr:TetR/AcrR family transcriptional regulator [Planctomycetota bacterium]MCB9824931.1 TetR/AcrR family transcriptional regulator [Planctomycetota bacterium]MCB9901661.1 TetR/AcrR family transcriptional regulator [Planctomycetota bacterium]
MAGRPLGRDARRRQMRSVVVELLGEHGFHGFGMRDVAARSRQSVANVYHHVADKEELVHAALVELLEGALATAEATLAVRGARERLRALCTDHVTRLVETPAEAPIWRGAWPPLREAQRRRLAALRTRYIAMLQAHVDELCGRQGRRRAADERRVLLLLALLEGAAAPLERGATPARIARGAQEALALFLEGALPRTRSRG